MMEVLHFIFSGFWVWLGSVVLLSVCGGLVVGVAAALRGGK